jgi:putative ABC transport system ATP-binding protein
MGLLLALNRDHGITVLMVTHEPDMAAYARRMVHLRRRAHRQGRDQRQPHHAGRRRSAAPAETADAVQRLHARPALGATQPVCARS